MEVRSESQADLLWVPQVLLVGRYRGAVWRWSCCLAAAAVMYDQAGH